MERRSFVGALLSGAAAGTTCATVTHAAGAADRTAMTPSVHIAVLHGLPQAVALARDLAAAMRSQGLSCSLQPELRLLDAPRIEQLLGLRRSALVVVADDATAVLVQAMAASRGQACVLQTHHRRDAAGSLHGATSPMLPQDLRWAEPHHDGSTSVAARLYAQALQPPAQAQALFDAELVRLADSTAAAAARRWTAAAAGLTSLAIRLATRSAPAAPTETS
jgi:hypothetical protein